LISIFSLATFISFVSVPVERRLMANVRMKVIELIKSDDIEYLHDLGLYIILWFKINVISIPIASTYCRYGTPTRKNAASEFSWVNYRIRIVLNLILFIICSEISWAPAAVAEIKLKAARAIALIFQKSNRFIFIIICFNFFKWTTNSIS